MNCPTCGTINVVAILEASIEIGRAREAAAGATHAVERQASPDQGARIAG